MKIAQSTTQFEKIVKVVKEFWKSSTHLMDSKSTDNVSWDIQNDNDDWVNLPLNIAFEDGDISE